MEETMLDTGTGEVMEKAAPRADGMAVLIINTLLMLGAVALAVAGSIALNRNGAAPLWTVLTVLAGLYLAFPGSMIYAGLRVLRPKEALVLTLFGKYYGTLAGPGFFFVNPFVQTVVPPQGGTSSGVIATSDGEGSGAETAVSWKKRPKTVSLKLMTLNNDRQKVNDLLGNPVIIGIAVIWRVVDTAKAVFSVDNYGEFLSIQSDSALRNIVRLYPYDSSGHAGGQSEKSLRGSSSEISEKLKEEIQAKVLGAGLDILEARITYLSYATEIATAMLQRQQAQAMIDARQMIVEGAVGMVEMALDQLSRKSIVNLDEERKAAMVSNLLVVLCGGRDAQPVVNTGSIY
jgi:regulator of protease activity HflC (stomatin/prohibitin superfamily)